MRQFILLSGAALSLFVGCATPQSVCETGAQTTCAKLYECASDALKSNSTFQQSYGTNVAECESKVIAANKCSEKKEFNQLCANTTMEYDLGKASECSDAIKAQACADFNDTAKRPAVCGEVCK
ncbi:hypothetical protein ACN28I_29935 [Archangium gephyra]|uniref:hypothetical protein n=1 Tax=Archangium gephyra TaxID=48 RepID=UPI003B7D1747